MPKLHHERDDERYDGFSQSRSHPSHRIDDEADEQDNQRKRQEQLNELESLLQFQMQSVDFFKKLIEISKTISADADYASGMLQDSYSMRSISKIQDFCSNLSKIGSVGEAEMISHMKRTRNKLDQFR